ncbi:MAG: family 16 glycosylhydrolase [Roseibacillus sp.]
MKTLLSLFSLIFGLLTSLLARGEEVSTRPAAPEGYRWESVSALSDEFESDALDESKWQPTHPYWSGREPSRFDSTNVSVKDGFLRLRSHSLVKELSEVTNPMEDVWVHSSCVTSLNPTARPGSYFECRMKASELSMTSSFWFQGKKFEIDVVEQIGAPIKEPEQAYKMLMNSHWFETKSGGESDHSTPTKWIMPDKSSERFHTYGLWWKSETEGWFYHDGVKVAEMTFPTAFTTPMFLFLDTEVFTWAGLPTLESLADESKNTMLVDWVRSWRLVPEESQ